MEEEKLKKSFWKRYEFLIIAVATLILIYIIIVFNQKINFILGNELIVYLEPQQKSFSMHYGNVSEANFDVSIDNFAYCRASCSYSFTDRSTNNIIDNGNFEIEKEQHFTKSYGLSVKRLGSGQDIYSFEVRCRSIRSFLCLTKSPEKSRSSLVTVNYDLTETEKELKRTLKQNVTKLLGLLSEIDVLNQQLNQKYFELAYKVNLNNMSGKKISINDAYDKTRISIENLRSLWAVENYIRLSQLFNESYFETLGNIRTSIENLDGKINNIIGLHNELLSRLIGLSKNFDDLNSVANILGDNETLNNLSVNADKFNKISSSIINNTFDSYEGIIKEIEAVTNQQNLIIGKSKIQAIKLYFNLEYFLNYEKDLLCSLNLSCKDNISIAKVIQKTDDFIKDYPDTLSLKQNCDLIKNLNDTYSGIRNETLKLIADKNISFSNSSFFLMLANDIINNVIKKINNSYYDSFEKIKSENKTNPDGINIASDILPKNKTDVELSIYNVSSVGLPYGEGCYGCGVYGKGAYTMGNDTIYFSLYLLSTINPSEAIYALLSKCQKLGEAPKQIGNFNFNPVSANITYNIISKIDTNLSDNPPICCVFNECKPCCRTESCRNDPKTFPIIFLHGHSFARDNSPEFSLDAFNKLQAKLQEDGYLNAGIVSLYSQNEPLQAGVWGLSGKPITVKASYYYDAFKRDDKYIIVPTKSENIDTYALRLKDLISIVKERTNKPKVNIIAHSMGGLVARRYIQIFGEDDIDKLVMIATPNKGVSGAVSDYCGYVGENRECQDMQENSLFINKVNDPLKQPKKAKFYNIMGQGCNMKLGNGDGIVLTENAALVNAKQYFLNGTCSTFGETLHTDILNIEKYPETYIIVKEILTE